MTVKTIRIIAVEGDGTKKTTFINSLGAVKTERSTTNEKSTTFRVVPATDDTLITFLHKKYCRVGPAPDVLKSGYFLHILLNGTQTANNLSSEFLELHINQIAHYL
jgi:hypothetical protein